MIKIKNLSKSYTHHFKQIKAVQNVNLEIKQGETFGFLGPNGAGKTTTIKLILGLLKPNKGTITIEDVPTTNIDIKKKIGFLPENPYFYPHLSGEEFLRFCGQIFNIPENKLGKKIKELLKKVRLTEFKKFQLRKYSKGMLQRIGIAQSLINDPEYIFWDEPLTGLDPIGRKEVKDIMLDLKKKKKTIFFNSHILSDIEELCTHIGIIHKGKLLKYGTIKQLCKQKRLEEYFIDVILKK